MLNVIDWKTASNAAKKQSLSRAPTAPSLQSKIEEIIDLVQTQGDAAVFALTKQFDGVDLSSLQVSNRTLSDATITKKAYAAIEMAVQTVSHYHNALRPNSQQIETTAGVLIERIYRPIQRVGLYVPGGENTPLISSVIMQAIPARIAGCPIRILCTPPNKNGDVDANILVAARLCGIETIYTVGGAQAIAAMAYGTKSIPKVDKIFGPGNAYVTAAKSQVARDPKGVAIDMPAGPSEVMILADNAANVSFVAADLLAQAEHGPDAQIICICDNRVFAKAIQEEAQRQLTTLTRQENIRQSLARSTIIICNERAAQLQIVNDYAPEHLIINREDARTWVSDITSAGTVFLGPLAAETLGDYMTGSNHVLPTNGYARNHSGLSTKDFLKEISIQSITAKGLKTLGPAAITLADLERLDAHAAAVRLRLNTLGDEQYD
ncbi:MAG: histidinol dehydrogenase [Gammaproteobacteria bacterium]|nr:histidinol dehydrogenase [Gammaproteobacteria bacterium]